MAVIGVSSRAFVGQSTITSVKFGSTCTYVGKEAFKECTSLEIINDDNVIEKIYDGAFASTKLSSVNFSKLKSIISSTGMTGAFANCSCLTQVNIPNCTEIGTSAFANCGKLTNIDLKNCRKIEAEAFAYCKSLEELTLNTESGAYNVLAIGDYAFLDCTNLKKITLLPYSHFGGIGSSAFFNCTSLSAVYIKTPSEQQKSVPVIPLGNDVFHFYADKDATSMSIISNLKIYLGADIFNNYYNDPKWSVYKDYMVKFPYNNQIVYITNNDKIIDIDGDSDYSDSDQYNKYDIDTQTYDNFGLITFTKNITSLNTASLNKGEGIFKGNKKLKSIFLPSECTEIGECEFEGCTSLDKFEQFPTNTLITIGDFAFKDCTSLKSFTIPESIEELGEGIFAGCSNIKKFEGKFTSYYGKAIVYYKSLIKGNVLISVAPKYNSEIDESYYKISDINSNIKRLGHYCFSKCDELRRVDIPHSTEIGDFSFEGCDNLREVHFYGGYPHGSIEFGKNAFGIFKKDENGNYTMVDENKNDFKIFVPEGSFYAMFDEIDSIENSWIKVYKNYIYPEPSNKYIIYYTNTSQEESQEDNKNYNLIEINSGEIQKNSFGDNKDNISKIIIGEKITKINKDAFSKYKGLEYICLPNSLIKIGGRVFQECENLKNISIPNNVDAIGSYCFQLSGIKEFNINYGSKLTKISQRTFINCSNLSIVDLSKSKILESIDDYAFAYCENLKDVKLANTITSIGDMAFVGCDKISSITLPSELKKLGDLCLSTTSELCIYIPHSLSTPPIFTKGGYISDSSYPFGNIDVDYIPQIFVPSDFEDTYKNDKYWGKYKEYIKTY